jgi:acyl carrier protein
MNKEFDDVLATILGVSKKALKMYQHEDQVLSLESIDIVSLIAAFDVYLNIKIKVKDIQSCQYVRDIRSLIHEKSQINETQEF